MTVADGTKLEHHNAENLGILRKVRIVPKMSENLVSIGQLCDEGNEITFTKNNVFIKSVKKPNSSPKLLGRRHGNLYNLLQKYIVPKKPKTPKLQVVPHALVVDTVPSNPLYTLHARMGHLNYRTLIQGIKRKIFTGTGLDHLTIKQLNRLARKAPTCRACGVVKITHKPVSRRKVQKATAPFQVVHIDVIEYTPSSYDNKNYALVILDSYSGFSWVFPLYAKSDAPAAFRKWLDHTVSRYGANIGTVNCVRSDGAKELTLAFQDIYADYQIARDEHTAPYNSIGNRAERLLRTLQELAASITAHVGAPENIWTLALKFANDTRNLWPTAGNQFGRSPYELLEGHTPSVKRLRTFYSPVLVKQVGPEVTRSRKNGPRGYVARFVGYPRGGRGYLIRTKNGATLERQSVYFLEDFDRNQEIDDPQEPEPQSATPEPFDPDLAPVIAPEDFIAKPPQLDNHAEDQNPEPAPAPQRPRRARRPHVPHNIGGSQHEIARALQVLSDAYTPTSLADARRCEDAHLWEEAIRNEYDNMESNKVWEIVKDPGNIRNKLRLKFVFACKGDKDGNLLKRKVRIVAKGYTQVHGIDYKETFAPTVRMSSLRLVLALIVQFNLVAHQFDISAAFLTAFLVEDLEIYVKAPANLKIPKGHVLRLRKALYGT